MAQWSTVAPNPTRAAGGLVERPGARLEDIEVMAGRAGAMAEPLAVVVVVCATLVVLMVLRKADTWRFGAHLNKGPIRFQISAGSGDPEGSGLNSQKMPSDDA
jgi:hypothetical protein